MIVVSPDFLQSKDGEAFATVYALQLGLDQNRHPLVPLILRSSGRLPPLLGGLVSVDYEHPRNGGERALDRVADAIAGPVLAGGFTSLWGR